MPNERGSREWWLDRLLGKMPTRKYRLDQLERYTTGDAPLPEGAEGFREAYRAFQRKARTNFAEIIVEAVQERMTVTGYRIGDDGALEAEAARIWSINEMDTLEADVHGDMLQFGEAFVIVGPPEVTSAWDWLPWRKSESIPPITREDPRYCICEHDPLSPNRVIAALKLVADDVSGDDLAYLYLPGYVHVARRDRKTNIMSSSPFEFIDAIELPSKVIPVIHFQNRRALGEFESHTDLLDRINYMVLQRLVIAAMQAYRQRAIEEPEDGLPEVDESGEPIDYGAIFRPGPGALWRLPKDAKLWESQSTDITPLLTAVKDDIRDLAAVTRTPMSMLLPDGANQSAEGAAFAREGLVFKTTDRMKRASSGWNQVMQIALLFAGKGLSRDIEVLWLPADRPSLAERADAASKATDLPLGTKLRKIWGFHEAEAERIEQERMNDVFATLVGTQQQVAPVTKE